MQKFEWSDVASVATACNHENNFIVSGLYNITDGISKTKLFTNNYFNTKLVTILTRNKTMKSKLITKLEVSLGIIIVIVNLT